MERIRAYILKLHSGGFHQVMGPYTAAEVKGFEGDVLLLERRATTDEDRTDVNYMLRTISGSHEPMWAVLSPAPAKKE
jgi:hypothetical protein